MAADLVPMIRIAVVTSAAQPTSVFSAQTTAIVRPAKNASRNNALMRQFPGARWTQSAYRPKPFVKILFVLQVAHHPAVLAAVLEALAMKALVDVTQLQTCVLTTLNVVHPHPFASAVAAPQVVDKLAASCVVAMKFAIPTLAVAS